MAQASPTSDAFSQNQIVPDVLPSLNSQLQEATVTYGQSKVLVNKYNSQNLGEPRQ